MDRRANINRKTKETDINLEINLDGSGNAQVETGIGFQCMPDSFSRHGF